MSSAISSSSTGTLSAAQLALLNGTSSSSSAAGGLPTGTAIQDEFLTLFTTQLKNQDPMNPMDSSQMTSQLAQISTVSGINQLDSTVKSLMSSNNVMETAQSAALIGRTVLGPGSQFAMTPGTPVQLGVSMTSAADTVKATIKDSFGNVVKSFDLGAQSNGVVSVPWDGLTTAGVTAPAGTYRLEVTASSGGTPVTATPLVQGKVTGVTSSSAGISVDVAGLGSVALGAIAQIN